MASIVRSSSAHAIPALTAVVLLAGSTLANAQDVTTVKTSAGPMTLQTIAADLNHAWSLAFLPDGRMLVTEREGNLRIVTPQGETSAPLGGLPKIYARGQGGLLDVALAPDFAQTGMVYLSFSEPREGGAGTSVMRGRLVENGDKPRLEGVEVIFRQQPAVNGSGHFGSRLVFDRDGGLFVTTGDRQSQRAQAQNLTSHIGKVVRIHPDGTAPKDNPFVGQKDAQPEIWSLGHRNMQGAALDPQTGRLWTVEHGARGGDELNRPEAGKNYGWPVISYGREYSGLPIGEGTEKEGMEQPVKYWEPSISPSGLAFYEGDLIGAWKGDVFTGGLSGMNLVRLELDEARGKVVGEEVLLEDLGARIRDVRQGPDGALWLLTDDSPGKLLRLAPAS